MNLFTQLKLWVAVARHNTVGKKIIVLFTTLRVTTRLLYQLPLRYLRLSNVQKLEFVSRYRVPQLRHVNQVTANKCDL